MTGKVAITEAMRFMVDCLKAAGANTKPAEQQAELLIQADRCGHFSHGLNRLERYVIDIMDGACKPNNTPKVLSESPSTVWIDANNVLGATSSHFATDMIIEKAQETGVAWAAVKGCNHFGIGGYWSHKVADKGMIGMAFTNGSPLLAPTRSKKAALGTNPLSVVAPASEETGNFYLDIATSAVAIGKIEMMRRRGLPIPPGWALGPDGQETVDATLAMKARVLMPLGGSEKSSGYKGFGLSAMVEIFSGILSGAKYGHHVRDWGDRTKIVPANLGHSFVAVNHACFAPGFEDRVTDCIEYWRSMEPADPNLPVLAPGDIEKRNACETDARGSIIYLKNQLDGSQKLAEKLKVKPLVLL